MVALFRAARIACTGEYGPFEELSFGGLDRWVRICESENGFYLLRQRDCTFGFGRAGVGKRGGGNKNKNKNHLFFLSSYPLYIQIPPEKHIPSFSLFTSPSLSQRPRPPAPELHGIEIDISRCKLYAMAESSNIIFDDRFTVDVSFFNPLFFCGKLADNLVPDSRQGWQKV